jgi:CRP-like cAMP-binding protein
MATIEEGQAMNNDVVEKLSAHELFRGLSADEIGRLMSHAATLTIAADQPVFEAGAEERSLYFLLEGTVEIELTVPFVKDVILDELNPVSVFGESSFFHSRAHSVTARAVTEAVVARLERAAYDALLQSNSTAACRLGANAAEILAAKLQHTDDWITELLQAEEAHRVQQKWRDFRQSLGHAFDRPGGGGFSTGAGWR